MGGNIYLNISHHDYILAHEMGHAAEEFLFKDNEEFKEIKEDILNNSIIILWKVKILSDPRNIDLSNRKWLNKSVKEDNWCRKIGLV